VTTVVLVVSGDSLQAPTTVACLAVVAILAERRSVRLTSTTEVSIALVPTLFAAVLFGPLEAMVVAAASMIADRDRGATQRRLKLVVYTSTRVLTAAVAGCAAVSLRDIGGVAGIAIASLVAASVAEFLETAFAAATRWLRRTGSPWELVRAMGPLVATAVPLYAPIVALLAVAYEEVSAWTLPLFLVPALAAQQLFVLYQDQRALAADTAEANARLERANVSFATALVATLDARDRYTAGHSAAVAEYARLIAERLGLSYEMQERSYLAGLVHDIGKVGLPAGILEKGGPLTPSERRQMEQHAVIGERILANVDDYAEIATIVRHHHERVDGNGYPDRKRHQQIPLISRIIGVADAYDAMTSDRPYRQAMPKLEARRRLADAAGVQFDADVVAAFEGVLAAEPAPTFAPSPPLALAAAV
jgi:putative nucleotidyltransferase with HDIG domain